MANPRSTPRRLTCAVILMKAVTRQKQDTLPASILECQQVAPLLERGS